MRRRLRQRYGHANFVTKPGKEGPLYRYVITYTDKHDDGFGSHEWSTWAYSLEHAEDKFFEHDSEFTEGLSILNLRRMLADGGGERLVTQHRAIRHDPRG